MNSFVGGGIGRNSSIRGRVGFTPKWMSINPKDYVKSSHNGVMATNRCGRDDLIGVQKPSQAASLPSSYVNSQQPQQHQQVSSSSSSIGSNANMAMRGMTAEQKKAKRKRDLLTQTMSDITSDEERRKRIRYEQKEISNRSVPTSYLFKRN